MLRDLFRVERDLTGLLPFGGVDGVGLDLAVDRGETGIGGEGRIGAGLLVSPTTLCSGGQIQQGRRG